MATLTNKLITVGGLILATLTNCYAGDSTYGALPTVNFQGGKGGASTNGQKLYNAVLDPSEVAGKSFDMLVSHGNNTINKLTYSTNALPIRIVFSADGMNAKIYIPTYGAGCYIDTNYQKTTEYQFHGEEFMSRQLGWFGKLSIEAPGAATCSYFKPNTATTAGGRYTFLSSPKNVDYIGIFPRTTGLYVSGVAWPGTSNYLLFEGSDIYK